MIFIDVDTAIVVPVNVCPLIDDTDFKSREVAIAYNQAGMDLVWNFLTSAGVHTQTAVTPTTAGVYDWAHAGDGMYTIEIPASGGGSINNDTEGYGWFSGFCTGVLPWRGPTIGFRAAALNNALVDGGDNLDVMLAAGAVTDASLAGNMEIVFETDFATNYNTTRNAWATNVQDFVGTTAADPFGGYVVSASVTAAVTLPTIPTDWITANGIAANAIGASELAENYPTLTELTAEVLIGTTAVIVQVDANETKIDTAQADLNTITGTDGVTLATAQGNYAPNVVVPDAAGVAPTAAEINAEVVDALNVDTYAEPGQGTPAATTSLAAKINYLYKNWRNKKTQTATTWSLLNDDAATVDQKATVADDATTASKTEIVSGP